MKHKVLSFSLGVVTSLSVLAIILTVIHYQRPIRIMSSLQAGEFMCNVELSDGKLWFKNENDIAAQLDVEDFAYANRGDYFITSEDNAVHYYELNGGKKYSEQELLKMANIAPQSWAWGNMIPDGFFRCNIPSFVDGEQSDVVYIDNGIPKLTLFSYGGGNDGIAVFAAPTPVKWQLNGTILFTSYYDGGSLFSINAAFGELDSRIGDIPISVKYTEGAWSSFFIIEQTAYQVVCSREKISQESFVRFLISICEAPHPEKKNLIDLLLNS